MAKKLAGKVAVVTGASKGIGAAIALHLAAEGAAVVVNYASSKQGAERVVGEITARGGKAIAVQADVAKPEDIRRLFAEAKRAFGRHDVLRDHRQRKRFPQADRVANAAGPDRSAPGHRAGRRLPGVGRVRLDHRRDALHRGRLSLETIAKLIVPLAA